jgi:hypothetical protein
VAAFYSVTLTVFIVTGGDEGITESKPEVTPKPALFLGVTLN